MKFYADLLLDNASQIERTVCFELEAQDAQSAMALISAYAKGRFEASGIGANVERLATTKARGTMYRRL